MLWDTGSATRIPASCWMCPEENSIRPRSFPLSGELRSAGRAFGYIEYEEEKKIGIIEKNTDIGIFGQIFPGTQLAKEKVMIGYKQEVKEGKAQLLMQSEGKTEKYDIEITEIYSSQQDTNKSFQIQVTDPELLAKTGGSSRE